jgi:hypothetical protein
MVCVKVLHKTCPDHSIIQLTHFYNSAQAKFSRDLYVQFGELSKRVLKKKFIDTEETSDTDQTEDSVHPKLEGDLDEIIRKGLRKMQEQVFRLQKEAIQESQEIDAMTLDKIDYIKKKCSIKLDRKEKTLVLKFKHSNKIQEYLTLNKFLKTHFEAKFQRNQSKLMKFGLRKRQMPESICVQSGFLNSLYSPSNRTLSFHRKKNTVWKNAKGSFKQMALINQSVSKGLMQVQVSHLNLASQNFQVFILNEFGFNFWIKRVKSTGEEDFKEVPCLARADFDLRVPSKVAKFCRQHKETLSLEKSVNGCQRTISECTFMVQIDQKAGHLEILKLDTESIDHFRFGRETETPAKTAELAEVESVVSENGDDEDDEDADWEDVTEDSTENEEPTQKISSSERVKMQKYLPKENIYVGFLFSNEYVTLDIKFHTLQA